MSPRLFDGVSEWDADRTADAQAAHQPTINDWSVTHTVTPPEDADEASVHMHHLWIR